MLSDDENLAKGCQFPFLSDDDLKGLRDGTVIAHEIPQGCALEDVIGINHGIGVDNAQGSGKIAGKTPKAKNEISSLSYITGRSIIVQATPSLLISSMTSQPRSVKAKGVVRADVPWERSREDFY